MKAQTKALIASAVVIVLALSAVSGITYSWWSDSEEAQVNVTTGSMKLDMELGTATVSGDGSASTVSPTTAIGSTSFVATYSWTAACADVLTIPITSAVVKATISTKYVESYSINSTGTVDMSQYVTVTSSGLSGVPYTKDQTSGSEGYNLVSCPTLTNKNVVISIDSGMPSELQGMSFSIVLTFSIYQSSTPDSVIPSGASGSSLTGISVVDGEPTEFTLNNSASSSDIGSTTIAFDGTPTNAGTYTAETVTSDDVQNAYDITTSTGECLGGVKVVNQDTASINLSGTTVTVKFIVDKVLSSNPDIYHNGSKFIDGSASDDYVSSESDLAPGKAYMTSVPGTGQTTIIFQTDDGFSIYSLFDRDVYCIYTAIGLTAFSQSVNNGNTYIGKTIKLMNEIDLNGIEWTPIGYATSNESIFGFGGTFDGNGKTVYGLKVTKTPGNIADSGYGFFGWLNGTVKDLKISGASISGHHFVGGIAGYLQFGLITGCSVTDSVLRNTADTSNDGSKTGGIVGYINSPNSCIVTNNIVSGLTLEGVRDIGCITGYVYANNEFSTNTVSGTNSITADSTGIKDSTDGIGAGIIYGRSDYPITSSNTDSSTTTVIVKVNNEARLAEALQIDVPVLRIVLTGDIAASTNKVSSQVLGALGGASTQTLMIDGDDHKLTFGSGTGNPASFQGIGKGFMFTNSTAKLVIENTTLLINCNSKHYHNYNILFSCNVELRNCTTQALAFHGTALLDNVNVVTDVGSQIYAVWVYGGSDVTFKNSVVKGHQSTNNGLAIVAKVAVSGTNDVPFGTEDTKITLIDSEITADEANAVNVGQNAVVTIKVDDETTYNTSAGAKLVGFESTATVTVTDLNGTTLSDKTEVVAST